MQIRRNTKQYKSIIETFAGLSQRNDRQEYVKLYFVEPGKSLTDKIDIEKLGASADFYYNLNYDNILNGLNNKDLTLHESDEQSGLYYFKDRHREEWDQMPFRLPVDALKNPKFFLENLPPDKPRKRPEKVEEAGRKKSTAEKPKPAKKEKPKPLFDLGREIRFTDLDKEVFPRVSKKRLLDYYYNASPHILPFLQDRPALVRMAGQKEYISCTAEHFGKKFSWLKTRSLHAPDIGLEGAFILCNDREHLMALAEAGAVGFKTFAAKADNPYKPDWIAFHTNEGGFEAEVIRSVLQGCKLPYFHVQASNFLQTVIPLDSASDAEEAGKLHGFLMNLIRLKTGPTASSDGQASAAYSRFFMQAPFCLFTDETQTPRIANPAKEIEPPLELNDKTAKQIEKRRKMVEAWMKEGVRAEKERRRLDQLYGFLLD